MHYSLLIYASAGVFDSLSSAEQQKVMDRHGQLQEAASKGGEMAVARLMPVSNAVTVRADPGKAPLVIDGPFAETKEQFMGIYIIECESLDDAVEHARSLADPAHTIEVRPVMWAGGVLANSA